MLFKQTFFPSTHFSADISKDKWEKMMSSNNWNAIEMRDNRYNQILHLVSAANGAEEFYTTEVSVWERNQIVIPNEA